VGADLDLALRLADAADEIALSRFRARDLIVETKPDRTPVTEADRAVEKELRTILGVERRRDAILGEEFGASGGVRDDRVVAAESRPGGTVLGTAPEGIGSAATAGSGGAGLRPERAGGRSFRRWIVDPIDGTRNYLRGVPVWATLIALEEHGRVTVGVVSAPALHRRWWAERDAGAHANGDVVRVSRVARPEDAVLTFALEQSLPSLAGRAWHARGYGDFWSHMLVAEGAVDGAIDAIGVSVWDLAAVQVIVEEAGGTFTDFAGEERIDGHSAISSNGLLHAELLEAVRELDR
jgi:histidinol-phosphatase